MTDEFIQEDAFLREAQRNEDLLRREKMRDVDFGIAVQKFLDGPIGQRILADAEKELKDIVEVIFNLNIDVEDDRNHLRELMARAGILRHWQNAFGTYIISGQNAERELEQMG